MYKYSQMQLVINKQAFVFTVSYVSAYSVAFVRVTSGVFLLVEVQ